MTLAILTWSASMLLLGGSLGYLTARHVDGMRPKPARRRKAKPILHGDRVIGWRL